MAVIPSIFGKISTTRANLARSAGLEVTMMTVNAFSLSRPSLSSDFSVRGGGFHDSPPAGRTWFPLLILLLVGGMFYSAGLMQTHTKRKSLASARSIRWIGARARWFGFFRPPARAAISFANAPDVAFHLGMAGSWRGRMAAGRKCIKGGIEHRPPDARGHRYASCRI